jgi:hypothetical protein
MPAGKTKIEPDHFNGGTTQRGKKAHNEWNSGRPRDDVLVKTGGNPPDRKPTKVKGDA